MKKLALILFATLAACAGYAPEDVQTVPFWGLGWQTTGTQNRIQPAIPPLVRFLRQRYPAVRPAEPSKALIADYQNAVLKAPPPLQKRFDVRLVGAFTVSGLPCAAEVFPVRDYGKTVAAFVVLDAAAIAGPPESWKPCPPVPAAEPVEPARAPALRALLAASLNAAAAKP